MNCLKCGQPLDPGAAFCGNCGQAVPTAGAVAQVYNNQAAVSASAQGNFNNVAALGAMGISGAMPAYATTFDPAAHSSEVKAIIGLILGVIGIPASFVPILGLILGVSGLILATIARSRYKRILSTLAIIFSSLAIVIALAAWTWTIVNYQNQHKTTAVGANQTGINTPCYNVKLDGGLSNYKPTGCSFDSNSTTEEFTVESTANANVTTANLDQVGQSGLAAAAKNINASIKSEQTGQFAGSPAYIAYMNCKGVNSDKNLVAAVVLHPTASGDNLFVVIRVIKDAKADFGPMEANWQWK